MQKKLSLIFLSALLVSACGAEEQVPGDTSGEARSSSSIAIVESSSSESVAPGELPEGDFSLTSGMPEGTVYLKGYGQQEVVIEPFCEGDDCPEYDYVFLVVTKSGNADFDEFLGLYGGNAFASDLRIGLGCLEDDQIVYENDSDQHGRKEFTLDEDLTEKILAATESEPVTLKVTKLPLSGGAGAPACYAHFTIVEEWETE